MPDRFLFFTFSFSKSGDEEFVFFQVFNLLSNLLQAGIALWDPYAQMPNTYFVLGAGYFQPNHTLTAFIYMFFHHLLSDQARGWYIIYSICYHIPSMFMRSAGIYLHIGRWTKNTLITLLMMVLGNTILIPTFYIAYGTEPAFVYSMYPMVVHFILKFAETKNIKYLNIFIFLMTAAIIGYPIIALGYFYQSIHIFILCTLVWFIIKNYKEIKIFKRQYLKLYIRNITPKILLTLILCLLMLAPLMYLLTSYKDYDFGDEPNRFSNLQSIINPYAYFFRVGVGDYFKPDTSFGLIDFDNGPSQKWWNTITWHYIGFTSILLAGIGAILSKGSKRYIIIGTLVFVWLLNSPREAFGLTAIPHWINAITNPFNLIVRDMKGAAHMLPFLIVVPISLGIKAIFQHQEKTKIYLIKYILITLTIGFYSIYSYLNVNVLVQKYVLIQITLISMVFIIKNISIPTYVTKKKIYVAILCLMYTIDFAGAQRFMNVDMTNLQVQPFIFSPNTSPAIVDFQNPGIIPFRQYYNTQKITLIPTYGATNNSRKGQTFYYHYVDFDQLEIPGNPYYTKHITYKALSNPSLQTYLNQNDNRLVYFAQAAVPYTPEAFDTINTTKQNRSIITVDGQIPSTAPNYFSSIQSINNLLPKENIVDSFDTSSVICNTENSKIQSEFILCSILLPDTFPNYLASSLIEGDRDIITLVSTDTKYSPAQGNLSIPQTFDVGNIQTQTLTIALPADTQLPTTLKFSYRKNFMTYIESIQKYNSDTFAFTFTAPNSGWLVFHYPYDTKWKLTLDGNNQLIYQVNQAFMGIPIGKGNHHITLEYWPNPLLRFGLFVAMIAAVLIPIGAFYAGVHEE